MKRLDLSGKIFGLLTAISYSHSNERGLAIWKVRCECGVTKEIIGSNLLHKTRSCGCRRFTGHPSHGKSKSHEYSIWNQMWQRCTNPKSEKFPSYGGRGITVDDRWDTFDKFYADMGPKPAGMTLERKDNFQSYGPDNCVWASPKEQANNRRSTRWLSFRGDNLRVCDWSKRTGISQQEICRRLNRGWSVDKTLTQIPRASRFKRAMEAQ